MNTTVLHDGDRVWLEGVRGWSWRERRSSVHAAQESVLRAAGEAVSYASLVGVSGLAFRIQLSRSGFCPSSPHPFCGYQCVAGSAAALPWKVHLFRARPEAADAVAETRRAVVESIERGLPVQYGGEEDGIIAGYQKDGGEWLCFHPRWKAGSELFVETEWPWGVGVYTGKEAEPPDRRTLAVEALQQAVRMAALPEVGGYFLGMRAWEEYISRAASVEAEGQAMAGNVWIYACLAEHRACAAAYLAEVSAGGPPISWDGRRRCTREWHGRC